MLEFNTGQFNVDGDEGYVDLSLSISAESNMYSRVVEGVAEPDNGFGSLLFNAPENYATRYEFNFGLEFNVKTDSLKGTSDMIGDFGFDADMQFIEIAGDSAMNSVLTRDISLTVGISALSEMTAMPAYYQQSFMELHGAFAPGDRIVIDAARMSITRNGQNALHYLSGKFFDLNLGPNAIIYTDDAAARNVLIRISHRDRHI